MLNQPQNCTDVAWLLMDPELFCEQALNKSLEIPLSYFLFLGCSLHADWHCIDSLLQEWSLGNRLLLLACWCISISCCSSYIQPNTSSSRKVVRKFEHSFGFFCLNAVITSWPIFFSGIQWLQMALIKHLSLNFFQLHQSSVVRLGRSFLKAPFLAERPFVVLQFKLISYKNGVLCIYWLGYFGVF